LNDPATGSKGDSHRTSVHLQVFQSERGHFNEPLTPVDRDTFLTMDDLATSAGALDHSVRAVDANNLIDTSGAVGIQPINRDGHRVTGVISPYLLAMNAAELNRRV
jgi:hypothetical protein